MTTQDPIPSVTCYGPYVPHAAHVSEGRGPERVDHDPDPTYRPRPVGFAPAPRHRANVPVDSPSRLDRLDCLVPVDSPSRLDRLDCLVPDGCPDPDTGMPCNHCWENR